MGEEPLILGGLSSFGKGDEGEFSFCIRVPDLKSRRC